MAQRLLGSTSERASDRPVRGIRAERRFVGLLALGLSLGGAVGCTGGPHPLPPFLGGGGDDEGAGAVPTVPGDSGGALAGRGASSAGSGNPGSAGVSGAAGSSASPPLTDAGAGTPDCDPDGAVIDPDGGIACEDDDGDGGFVAR